MINSVDVGKIKGTSITADWQPLAAQSMVGSITDDSLGAILTTCEKVSNCDDKLVRGLTNLIKVKTSCGHVGNLLEKMYVSRLISTWSISRQVGRLETTSWLEMDLKK